MKEAAANSSHSAKKGLRALSPAILFLLLYVVISLIAGDFYIMPVTVALSAASIWGIAVMPKGTLIHRINVYSRGASNTDILYMIWVFVLAGGFASLAKSMGAIDATVALTFKVFPTEFILPACFFASCLISFAIGTSVGAVVALTPLTLELATASGASVPLFVAATLGGAFFGDNLSFISDTTIAATRTQGCKMNDKFKANIQIVLPAAIIVLIIYCLIGNETADVDLNIFDKPWWLTTPYLLVIVTAIAGINVMIVLITGIASAIVIGMLNGLPILNACKEIGAGIDSMGQLIIITLLATGMLNIVKNMGGIDYLLKVMTSSLHNSNGAKWCIAWLVMLVNLCTANNTIAILTVGPLANKISTTFGISRSKTASLLDTCSCIVQCLIPYGAQCLLASGLAAITPGEMLPYLYYPWMLMLMVFLSIMFNFPRDNNSKIFATASN